MAPKRDLAGKTDPAAKKSGSQVVALEVVPLCLAYLH